MGEKLSVSAFRLGVVLILISAVMLFVALQQGLPNMGQFWFSVGVQFAGVILLAVAKAIRTKDEFTILAKIHEGYDSRLELDGLMQIGSTAKEYKAEDELKSWYAEHRGNVTPRMAVDFITNHIISRTEKPAPARPLLDPVGNFCFRYIDIYQAMDKIRIVLFVLVMLYIIFFASLDSDSQFDLIFYLMLAEVLLTAGHFIFKFLARYGSHREMEKPITPEEQKNMANVAVITGVDNRYTAWIESRTSPPTLNQVHFWFRYCARKNESVDSKKGYQP